ncbi:MAG: hypothetical protein PHO32_00915 [Candidatus Cloacimonetes bacterium]|nr:hypothetical protein [Candidatus Cloacimonadota bacterium]
MKQIIIAIAFLMLLLPLVASGLEDCVNDMLALGQYTTIDGNKVFMSSTYWSDKVYEETGAYNFITFSAYYFLAVHHEWDTMSSSSIVSNMESADCIACPWSNGYGAALLTIKLSDIYNNFGSGSYDELGEEGLVDAINTFIHRNGDRSALQYEEEYYEE